jgi:protein-L-isoaspartate(D-aspartate) O-methyltransferase
MKRWLLVVTLFFSACSPQAEDRFEEGRARMVKEQLAGRDITDKRVLDVMRSVPRHEFVPKDVRSLAYADGPLHIGYEQTISQPYIVALMTQALDPKPADRVLEVGTGSGYQAAILAKLVRDVYTIEIVDPLAKRAAADLARLGFTNVHVKAGDGYAGWPKHAPFDAIIVTCAPEKIPPPLVDQLKEGGRMVIPVGTEDQRLYLMEKRNGEMRERQMIPVRFVPMTRGEPRSK